MSPENLSSEIHLSPTSFVVLGLVHMLGPISPYQLKKVASTSVADFHPVPHTTFYDEPSRLTAAGYLDESQETGGRRRKLYSLTPRGREVFEHWLADPEVEPTEVRSPAMLKVFFGADPRPIAAAQLERHARLLEFFESTSENGERLDPGPRRALETGIGYHRFWIGAWQRLRG